MTPTHSPEGQATKSDGEEPSHETRGGAGDDCSVGKRGAWPPEGTDGIRAGERKPELSVTAGETAPSPSDPSPLDVREAQPFERHPKLAGWIERLAGEQMGLSLIEWNEFLAAVNGAISRPVDREGAEPVTQEPVKYQYRVFIAGEWGNWIDLQHSVDKFRSGDWKFNLKNGTCELRALYAHPAAPTPTREEIANKIVRELVSQRDSGADLIIGIRDDMESLVVRGDVEVIDIADAILALLTVQPAGDGR